MFQLPTKMKDTYIVARVAMGYFVALLAALIVLDAIGIYHRDAVCPRKLGLSFKILLAYDLFEMVCYIPVLISYLNNAINNAQPKFTEFVAAVKKWLLAVDGARIGMIIYLMVQTYNTSVAHCNVYLWNSGLAYTIIGLGGTILGLVPLLIIWGFELSSLSNMLPV